jgi:hypothetical protein
MREEPVMLTSQTTRRRVKMRHLRGEGYRAVCECGLATPVFPDPADAFALWELHRMDCPLLFVEGERGP